MGELWGYIPGLSVLLVLSGFFSGSEAAFFSLSPIQRRQLSAGSKPERLAWGLLQRSERLLMGILFWNLAINLTYFSLVSRAALESQERSAAVITIGALVAIIIGGEFLPKSLSVRYPLAVVRVAVVPLAFSIRLVDIFLPLFRSINEVSRRLLWPGFKPESYLEIADLDRAVELSTEEAQLVDHESQVLRSVFRLSEIRVEEWMRPRIQHRSFIPPVSLKQLGGETTPSGYMLVTDPQGRDIVAAIDLASVSPASEGDLAELARPLVVIPWCASIADALNQLRDEGGKVAAVVNEYGESIGILTWEEIFEAILQSSELKDAALKKSQIEPDGKGGWKAPGTAKLRKLERVLESRIETGSGLTIAGVMQEQLHRIPEVGDVCKFEKMVFTVIEAEQRGDIVVHIALEDRGDDTRPSPEERQEPN